LRKDRNYCGVAQYPEQVQALPVFWRIRPISFPLAYSGSGRQFFKVRPSRIFADRLPETAEGMLKDWKLSGFNIESDTRLFNLKADLIDAHRIVSDS